MDRKTDAQVKGETSPSDIQVGVDVLSLCIDRLLRPPVSERSVGSKAASAGAEKRR